MNIIKNPIFVVVDDGEIIFVSHPDELIFCGMEPIDVANGIYRAYDSTGQIIKLVTINDETGAIEGPTENKIKIPFIGEIGVVSLDRSIKPIPTGLKDEEKLREILKEDLSAKGYQAEDLELNQLIKIYQEKNKKSYISE